MPFLNVNEREAKGLFPGIVTKTFWGDQMLVSRVELEPNAEVPMHSHPHEQFGVVLEGELTLSMAGETRELGVGDMYIALGNIEHGGHAGPDGCLVAEIFSPVREEYKFE